MPDEHHIASLLREAVAEVERAPKEAATKLAIVCDALAGEPALRDIYARACSLHAQALFGSGAIDAAREAIHRALREARALEDGEGIAQIRALHDRIAAASDRRRREALARAQAHTLAAIPREQLERDAPSPLARADVLIKHAGALRLVDRPDEAAHSARSAVRAADEARSDRERVLARITLAEICPGEAETALREAHRVADGASNPTLIGLVARAAELAGVELPRQYGPLDRSPS